VAGAAGTRGSARRSTTLLAGLAVNLLGAAVVLFFARSTIRFYESTHRLIGAAFIVQQVLVAAAFLVRRRPIAVSHRPLDWGVAIGGSFGGFLLRPSGYQPLPTLGIWVQVVGLALWALSFVALGRSFGLVAADRGMVTRGPYRVVRHPMYASYLVAQLGYLLQSASAWNLVVVALAWSCQVARSLCEERLLGDVGSYRRYQTLVRWRLVPGVW
jgi:protein-S-isoprenylcysteine O-methyltransferase Ste14